MHFSWILALLAIIWNVLMCGGMILAQRSQAMPARHAIIPGTRNKPFLYYQDFLCMVWGDWVGLLCVKIVFVHTVDQHPLTSEQKLVWVLVLSVSSVLYIMSYLSRQHKPDWGSTRAGTITVGGFCHSTYFGANLAAGVIVPWQLVKYSESAAWWGLGLGGFAIWLGAVMLDFRAGRLSLLR